MKPRSPLSNTDLIDRLPHRSPFRFLSEIAAMEPGVCGTATWEISGEEEFFAGHFPDQPIVPGVLIAESLAQLAGLVGFSEEPVPQDGVRLAHVDIKFTGTVAPPVIMLLSATVVRRIGQLMLFEVIAHASNKPVASGRLTLAAPGPVQEAAS